MCRPGPVENKRTTLRSFFLKHLGSRSILSQMLYAWFSCLFEVIRDVFNIIIAPFIQKGVLRCFRIYFNKSAVFLFCAFQLSTRQGVDDHSEEQILYHVITQSRKPHKLLISEVLHNGKLREHGVNVRIVERFNFMKKNCLADYSSYISPFMLFQTGEIMFSSYQVTRSTGGRKWTKQHIRIRHHKKTICAWEWTC